MEYDDKRDAEERRRYERDLRRDPVIQSWLADVATRTTQPQVSVTFIDPFPYDEIQMWTCDRCGCHVPTTVYGRKICGFCSGEGRLRSWYSPQMRKKLLEERVKEFLDD